MSSRGIAGGGLAAVAVALVAITAACSGGTSKSHGPATLKVSASPNGEASKTGPQVLADAMNALASQPTVHITGTDNSSGETVKIDLHVQTDGLSGSAQIPGGTEQVLSVNGKFYVKGFTAMLPAASFLPKAIASKYASQIEGKWLYFGPADNTNPMNGSVTFDEPANIKGLAAALRKLDKGVTVESAVTTETLDGQPVVVVSESNGTKFYVSATGEPLPLRFVGNGSDESNSGLGITGTATLGYGEDPVKLVAPAGAVSIQNVFQNLLPSALSSLYPSGFPTGFPTDLPTDFPSLFISAYPTAFPSGLPSDLASELKAFEQQQHGSAAPGSPAPAPTP